jgi:hypothetical protein
MGNISYLRISLLQEAAAVDIVNELDAIFTGSFKNGLVDN